MAVGLAALKLESPIAKYLKSGGPHGLQGIFQLLALAVKKL
jgi:hypothetical protein